MSDDLGGRQKVGSMNIFLFGGTECSLHGLYLVAVSRSWGRAGLGELNYSLFVVHRASHCGGFCCCLSIGSMCMGFKSWSMQAQ